MAQTQKPRQRGGAAPAAPAPEVRILTVDEIEQVDDLPELVVVIPEWGENVGVRIRALTKQQQIDIVAQATKNGVVDSDEADMLAIVAACVEPTFTKDQVGLLKSKNAAAIDRISAAMIQLNGLNAEALAAIEAAFRGSTG